MKTIIISGPPASGKTHTARQLAGFSNEMSVQDAIQLDRHIKGGSVIVEEVYDFDHIRRIMDNPFMEPNLLVFTTQKDLKDFK